MTLVHDDQVKEVWGELAVAFRRRRSSITSTVS
jgi:hypothetical protein